MAPQTEQKIYVGIGLDFETGGLDCRECACTQIALQAVRFDTWQVFDRYQAYIAPYGKQDAGLPRRKVLRTRHEQAKGQEYVPMKYEQAALDYSAITMEMLRTQGMDMKKVAGEVIAFAKRATLSKGNQCKPVLVGQNIAFDIGFLQQLVNYAGLAAEFEKTFSGSRDYYGNFQPHYIDTLALGRLAFAADPEVTSYKLELVASRLGVELDDAHDAAAEFAVAVFEGIPVAALELFPLGGHGVGAPGGFVSGHAAGADHLPHYGIVQGAVDGDDVIGEIHPNVIGRFRRGDQGQRRAQKAQAQKHQDDSFADHQKHLFHLVERPFRGAGCR